jgi:hypothetical protein
LSALDGLVHLHDNNARGLLVVVKHCKQACAAAAHRPCLGLLAAGRARRITTAVSGQQLLLGVLDLLGVQPGPVCCLHGYLDSCSQLLRDGGTYASLWAAPGGQLAAQVVDAAGSALDDLMAPVAVVHFVLAFDANACVVILRDYGRFPCISSGVLLCHREIKQYDQGAATIAGSGGELRSHTLSTHVMHKVSTCKGLPEFRK